MSEGTPPAEPITSFEEVGELLDRLADALQVVIRDYGPPWAPGAPAEVDCALDEALEGTPHLNAALMVGLYLNHAQDHLRAAARIVGDRRIVMGGFTLTRPVLGSAARAIWLLEPSITSTERLRRGLNLRLKGLGELENIASDRDPGFHNQLAVGHRPIVEAIERDARTLGLPPATTPGARKDGSRDPVFIGRKLPSDMELIRGLLDRDGSEETGDLIFRVGSAFVHGEYHVLNLLSRRISDLDPAPGVAGVEVGVRLDNLVVFVASVAIGIHRVALAACAYAGWPEDVWQNLAQPIIQRWQATLHVVRDTAFRDVVGEHPTA